MIERIKKIRDYMLLPSDAKSVMKQDRQGLDQSDPGSERAVREAAQWLCRAQDNNALGDDGVARDYSLISGWASSYPETTGYIVPTMIDLADYLDEPEYLERARRMLDWLAAIQFPEGGFQGGKIDASPRVPVTFNTGQILIGLCAGVARFGAYQDNARRAAQWLVDSQDEDGCWRRFPTPFAAGGEKVYESHVAWGLFEAEKVFPGEGFGEAGLRQVAWALGKQHANGWLEDCCLTRPDQPLTHTLGYALRGFVEAYDCGGDDIVLEGCMHTAKGLQSAIQSDGRLPGRLRADWSPAVDWVCLTGAVQIAHSFFLLWSITGDDSLRDSGRLLNTFVRRSMAVTGDANQRGGVKGSFPVEGDYGSFEYLNWAAKFCIDANLCELGLTSSD